MWFFNSKKSQGLKSHEFLDQLKKTYNLHQKAPSESSIMGDWWETRLAGRVLAFQERGKGLSVFVGEIEEITEIYLCRPGTDPAIPPAAVSQHLARIVGSEGAALADQFYLAAHPTGDFDYSVLRLPPLRDGIPQLSPSVREIAIYESFRGLSLLTDDTATVETIGADLKLALDMLKAMDDAEL